VPVSIEDVKRVARLAYLEFSPEEEEKLVGELNQILEYMTKLNALDTEGVVPTSHVAPVANAFREDLAEEFASLEELLAQGPDVEDGYFKVPRVIE